MKKIALSLFMILCLVLTSFTVLANPEGQNGNVEVRFELGSDILRINGEDVKVEAMPFAENGTTLVPLRVITEAFGATVDWEPHAKVVTLNYQDVVIVLQLGNSIVTVNGQQQTLLLAPKAVNSTTMVPLRFISETFGADVKYDEVTKGITIIKESVGSGDVGNIADVLGSGKTVVGDSYFGWSITRSADMELNYRSFDGLLNYFGFDEDVYLYIDFYQNGDNDGLEQIKTMEKEKTKGYTFVGQSVQKTASGVQYVKTQCRGSKFFADSRAYLYKDYVVVVLLEMSASMDASARENYLRLSDSFDFTFDAAVTDDLSDVENGMRLFQQKDFNVSFRMPADWYNYSNEESVNKFRFAGFDKNDKRTGSVSLLIYSKDNSMTVKEWAQGDLTSNARKTNPDVHQYTELQTMKIGSQNASYYTHTFSGKAGSYIGKDIFWEYEGYWYNLHIEVEKTKEAMIQRIIDTVQYGKIDANKVGQFAIDHSLAGDDSVVSTKKSSSSKLTMSIPSSWASSDDNTVFIDTNKGLIIGFTRYSQNITKSDMQSVLKAIIAQANKEKVDTVIVQDVESVSSSRLSSGSLSGFDYIVKLEEKSGAMYLHELVINDSNTSCVVTMIYPEETYSSMARETMAKIVKSVVLN